MKVKELFGKRKNVQATEKDVANRLCPKIHKNFKACKKSDSNIYKSCNV